jgi:hypothetical protein
MLVKGTVWIRGSVDPHSVVDPHHVDADPDSTNHLDVDPDLDSEFYLMRIQILFTLLQMRIRIYILASKERLKLLKNAQIGSYAILFGFSSTNRCRSGSGSGSCLSY